MKLLPSKLIFPVSHSGQKVMNPIPHASANKTNHTYPQIFVFEHLTSIKLSSSQHNHPEIRLGTPLANKVANVQRNGTIEKHCKQLETHNALCHPPKYQQQTSKISSTPGRKENIPDQCPPISYQHAHTPSTAEQMDCLHRFAARRFSGSPILGS